MKKLMMFVMIFVVFLVEFVAVNDVKAYEGPIHKMGCFMLISDQHYTSFTAQQCAELDEKYSVLRGYGGLYDHPHYIENADDQKLEDMINFIMKLMKSGHIADALHLLEDMAQPDHVVISRHGKAFDIHEHTFMDDQIPRVVSWNRIASTGDVRKNIKQLMWSSAKLRELCYKENRMPTSEETGVLFIRMLSVAKQLLTEYHVK